MKDDKDKKGFFEDEDVYPWREEWQDMPEFERFDNKPFQRIVINFETKEDVEEFSKLIGQNLTFKSNSIWFPNKEKRKVGIYIDES